MEIRRIRLMVANENSAELLNVTQTEPLLPDRVIGLLPMRWLYGYDVIADLPPTRYDEIAIALGAGGETVTDPSQIGPAIDRAMAAGIPYVVNVMTDPEAAYPRSTLGI